MKYRVLLALFGAGILALTTSRAVAGYQVVVSDLGGGNSVTILGNGATPIENLNGSLTTAQANALGLVSLGFSGTAIEQPGGSNIATTQTEFTAAVATSIKVVITDTFTDPTGSPLNVATTLGGTSFGTDSTSPTATANQLTSLTSGVNTGSDGAGTFFTAEIPGMTQQQSSFSVVRGASTYSITQTVILSLQAGFQGQINDNVGITARSTADVPEPASFTVWGGLLIAGMTVGIRRKK
jgi:hypothetical protein